MRYRPFGRSGQVVSAVSLLLDGAAKRSARDWRGLVDLALECGINTFEIAGDAPAVVEGAAQALSEVERNLLFVAWRPRQFTADPVRSVEAFVTRMGLDYLDLLAFDSAPLGSPALNSLRETRRVRAYGLAGEAEETDPLIAAGGYDSVALPYSPISGGRDRTRLKTAADRDMAVVAHGIWPDALKARPTMLKKPLFRDRANPLAGAGSYQFLENTPGWTAEEICLAYVLTEPAVTTVQVEAEGADRLRRLAEVVEKDLPAGVAAQIEMARFSATAA